MARASNEKPGVSLKITAKQKSIKDVTLGPEWQKIKIPVADLPESTQEIVIEVHPILWFFEYCYIDYIGVK